MASLKRHHALSVDVEDWYHDIAVGPVTAPASRVEANTLRLLDLLAKHDAQATFFFLGIVAEQLPQLVRDVAGAGHEIGSHGYAHRPVSKLSLDEFRTDVEHSLRLIEDCLGQPVRAYRAPYFSIRAGVGATVEILAELGIQYDSSILAANGHPGLRLVSPRRPYRLTEDLWEVPVAMLQFAFVHYSPWASGAGLRLLPPRLLDRWLRRFERDVGPGLFYLHPWEIDSESPTARRLSRWFLRPGRRQVVPRLANLMEQIKFSSIKSAFGDLLAGGTIKI